MDPIAAGASAPSLATIDTVIIVSFLVLVTLVGYMMSNMASKGLDDYFLGGKRIPWWVLGISTATSNFDMAGTMVIVAMVFTLGYKGFLVELRGGVGMSLGFLMVFLGKWLRRSRVMTSAEWMKIRFGTDKQGRWAHIISAGANIILALGMIIYFAKGAGLFLTNFLPLSEFTCTAAMVLIGLFYTLASGLYGVVFTDVVQMILLTFTAIYVSVHAWVMQPLTKMPVWMLDLKLSVSGGAGELLVKEGAKGADFWMTVFPAFGVCVVMWFFRSTLEGMGGVGGYTDQRFFAARTEREASLLTLESIILSIFRWTMVAGLVVMGYQLVQQGGSGATAILANPENVLPEVLGTMLPSGIRGLVIAGLIAAAMSTFDSTLNAGASYVVKDIYQSYVNPEADGKQLLRMSRAATVALCVAGVLLAAIVPNIDKIWDLITMGIGAGMFVPLFLRWYWPRFNGYGFAAGTVAGLVVAMIDKFFLHLPLYHSFPTIIGGAFVCAVLTALLTAPVDDDLLVKFFIQINPWGAWRRYARMAREQGYISENDLLSRIVENLNDVISLCFSVPFQLCALLAAMAFMWHDWSKFSFFMIITVVCCLGLYFFWYRNLKSEQQCKEEDLQYGG